MSGGGSVSSGDTKFERKGTATTTSFRDLGPGHSANFNAGLSAVWPSTANASVDGMLSNRLQGNVENRPYASPICNIIRSNLPNVASPGQSSLTAQANFNPLSDAYERGTFNRYAEEVQKAMGQARSGPAMTRGGTAAQGFAQAQVVNDLGLNREQVLAQNRAQDSRMSQGAAGALAETRQGMNNSAISAVNAGQQGYGQFLQNMMSAAGLASERTKMFNDLVPTYATLGSVMHGSESNNLYGKGAQSSTSFGGGVNLCCFIFMEAYNGEMPWWVRECRDEFAPESSARRVGYIRMSKWLVPAMRTSRSVRTLVNHLLIQPLTRWGAWHRKVPGGEWKCCDALARLFWFKLWELTGK